MRKALFRAYASLRARPLLRCLGEMERTQWFSRDEALSLQLGKLVSVLRHAGKSVPYYRDLFKQIGFDPETVRGVEDLAKLPALNRETLADRFQDLRAENAPSQALIRSTGGSTGKPTRFLVDRHEMTARSAHIYRNLGWLGWHLGDRIAYIWGSDIDASEHRGWIGRARDALAGVAWLDAFALDRKRLDEYLDLLERFDPAALVGYPSSLHLLAEHALQRGRQVRLRGIQTSAEMLAPRVRRDLETAFGCRVLDRYGCREAGVVAHECMAGSMHVNSESVVMECVEGEVLLTTLNNSTMPLIRYRAEDMADLSHDVCPCGRGLPLVRSIQGRRSDIIRAPGGRLIHGEFFTHLFYDAPGVQRFQVKQTRPDRLEISVVASDAFDAQARRSMEQAIHTYADPAFRIIWIPVSEIPSGLSGKFHFTLSAMQDDADNQSDHDVASPLKRT